MAGVLQSEKLFLFSYFLAVIAFSTIYLARPRGRISLIRHRVIRGYYLEL